MIRVMLAHLTQKLITVKTDKLCDCNPYICSVRLYIHGLVFTVGIAVTCFQTVDCYSFL